MWCCGVKKCLPCHQGQSVPSGHGSGHSPEPCPGVSRQVNLLLPPRTGLARVCLGHLDPYRLGDCGLVTREQCLPCKCRLNGTGAAHLWSSDAAVAAQEGGVSLLLKSFTRGCASPGTPSAERNHPGPQGESFWSGLGQ